MSIKKNIVQEAKEEVKKNKTKREPRTIKLRTLGIIALLALYGLACAFGGARTQAAYNDGVQHDVIVQLRTLSK